ncbi:MAG: methionyl-tRNA formyltransferase [Selenomonadaceae bacterium]
MKNLKVIFMGTPDFSVRSLEELQKNCEVIAVVTQPDRPRGRGQKLTFSPVKTFALANGLTVYQPERLKTLEFEKKLSDMHPDLIVVVAFGQILSQTILDIPSLGCINVHASLLPYYRGAAPIHWSIINGETKTGVTTMFMDAGLDTGDMILKKEVAITPEMTTEELHDQLMNVGAALLMNTVRQLAEGTVSREKQDGSISNYAPLLTKTTGRIDWNKSAIAIHNLVRGLNSWPGAYCLFNGEKLKIWRTRTIDQKCSSIPGGIVQLTKEGFLVGTGDGLLEVLELQVPNKRKMAANDYIRGYGLTLHTRLE